MREKVVKYGKGLALDALSEAIGGDEALYGPLQSLAAGTATNYAIFSRGLAPTPLVRLALGATAPGGSTKVCAAKLWVLNAELEVTAVR